MVAAISALVTYLVAARGLSGKIKNSDAEELWAESRSIREWSTSRVKELNEHVASLENRLNELERKNDELAKENRGLQREVYDLSTTIVDLNNRIAALTESLSKAQEEGERLRTVAEGAPRRRFSDGRKGGSE